MTTVHDYSNIIVIEGADGTGKSTTCKLLKKTLEDKGFKVALFNIISCSEEGKLFRSNYTTRELSGVLQATGFLNASTIAFEEHIFPASLTHDYVVVDRGWASIVAYQVYANGLSYVKSILSHILKDSRYTKIKNVYLTVTAEVALERVMVERGMLDHIESKGKEYQAKCVSGYTYAFKEYPCLRPILTLTTNGVSAENIKDCVITHITAG